MAGYLDGKVEILYDLGAVCNEEPVEAVLPYVVKLHDELEEREFKRLSELRNTVDLYRQGEMSYNEITSHVQDEIGEVFRNISAEKTDRYVEELLGVEEPSTNFVARMRSHFWTWVFHLGEPLVDPEVRTGNEVMDSAGAGFLGITDEPSFTAEPVKNYLLGLNGHQIAAAHYPYNEKRRFTGAVISLEDKGAIAENYLDYNQPDLSLALIDSPRDIPMGEATDMVYVIDPDIPVAEEMWDWTRGRENAEVVESPVRAVDGMYRDVVEKFKGPGTSTPEGVQKAPV